MADGDLEGAYYDWMAQGRPNLLERFDAAVESAGEDDEEGALDQQVYVSIIYGTSWLDCRVFTCIAVSASLTTIALPSHHHRTTIALPSHYHRTTIALPSRYHRTTIALPSHYMFCRVYLATLFGCDALQGEDQEHAAAQVLVPGHPFPLVAFQPLLPPPVASVQV